MLKNITQLEYVANGKLFHFTCDNDSQLPQIKDALAKFIQYIGQIEDNIIAQQKAKEEEEKAKLEPVAETIPA